MKQKWFIKVIVPVFLASAALVGVTAAYLKASDKPLQNTFSLAQVDAEIEENPGSGTASDKKPVVVNTGSSPIYIRAKAVVTTQENSPVAVSDNEISFQYGAEWQNGNDGYYYYKNILQTKGQTTTALFEGVTVSEDVSKQARFSVGVYQESALASANNVWSLEKAQKAFSE